MNHAGEIAPLARLARPHVAVITAIEKAHIGYLGSIEAIADEKAAILRGLEPGGVAVLPADYAACCRGCAPLPARGRAGRDVRRRSRRPMRGWSTSRWTPTAATVAVEIDGDRGALRLERARPAHGDERAGRAGGRRGARRARPRVAARRAGRLCARRRPRRAAARSPCRAAPRCCWTRATTATAPRCAPHWPCCGCSRRSRRIAVLGDMLELGDAGPAEHRALADEVAAVGRLLFACGPLMRTCSTRCPDRMRAVPRAGFRRARALVARAVAPGRRDPGQGQPGQPHEARGRGARRRCRTARGGGAA